MISTHHYIDLVDGEFAETTAEQLDTAFQAINGDPGGKNIVVHIHGGLVSRSSAMEDAEALFPVYRAAGAYPIFVCWNSDLWTTLTQNLDEIAADPLFKKLIKRVVRFVVSKVVETPGARSGGEIDHADAFFDVPDDLEELQQYADSGAPKLDPASDLEISPAQARQFQKELEQDTELRRLSRGIATSLDLADGKPGDRSQGAAVSSVESRISQSIKDEIRAETPQDGDRSPAVFLVIAKYGVEVLIEVMKRYATGTDHGAYTTAVEEILRTFFVDDLGGLTWKMMKKDTGDAFEHAGSGGIALMNHLAALDGDDQRITLVGHSTGAVFIGHCLEAFDRAASDGAQVNVVFLAAACSMPFIHQRLGLYEKRVRHIRNFGLSDDIEGGYWEVPVVYPKSLLYLVSGLLEDQRIDMPLVGMQRYYSGKAPYIGQDVQEVVDYLKGSHVWSICEQTRGRESTAQKHGGFFLDPATQRSLKHILLNGFEETH